MLQNPKFEWMLTFKPEHFSIESIETSYWTAIYNRIVSEGTPEDVRRLAELFQEAHENVVEVETGPLSFKHNLGWFHKRAAQDFISEVCQNHFDDEQSRYWQVKEREFQRRQHQDAIDQNGFTRHERATYYRFMEATHDGNYPVESNPTRYGLDAKGVFSPSLAELKEHGTVIDKLEINMPNRKITVFIFDRMHGLFSAAVLNSARPLAADGTMQASMLYNARLATKAGSGLIFDAIKLADREKFATTYSLKMIYDSAAKAKASSAPSKSASTSASKPRRKIKEPDISKIQSALGIDGNCGDDLDGDIF